VPELAEDAAERRAEDEADAEGGADQPEALGAVLGRGDVGERRGRRAERRAEHAGDQPPEEQQSERMGEPHQHIVDGEASERQQQHRPAAEAIAEIAGERPAQELHQRIDDRQPPTHADRRGQVELADLHDEARQHRDDDAEADRVDQDGGDDEDGGVALATL
jgi:hypothetical protein